MIKHEHQPCNMVLSINRVLNGNGERGALEKLDEVYSFMQQLRGAKMMLTAILGSSLIGLAVAVYSLFKR